jgi:hypothetical protein
MTDFYQQGSARSETSSGDSWWRSPGSLTRSGPLLSGILCVPGLVAASLLPAPSRGQHVTLGISGTT